MTSQAYPDGIAATTAVNDAGRVASITDTTTSGTLASFAYTRGNDGGLKCHHHQRHRHQRTRRNLHLPGAPGSARLRRRENHHERLRQQRRYPPPWPRPHPHVQRQPATAEDGRGAGRQRQQLRLQPPPATRHRPPVPRATTYGYNQANQLTSYTPPPLAPPPATPITATASALPAPGPQNTTASYAWDRDTTVPDCSPTATPGTSTAPTACPSSRSAPQHPTYLHHDQHGSTRLVTNTTGAVTGTYTYDAYGKTTSHTGPATTPFQYTGQYQDPEPACTTSAAARRPPPPSSSPPTPTRPPLRDTLRLRRPKPPRPHRPHRAVLLVERVLQRRTTGRALRRPAQGRRRHRTGNLVRFDRLWGSAHRGRGD